MHDKSDHISFFFESCILDLCMITADLDHLKGLYENRLVYSTTNVVQLFLL